jgi:NAD(P)-dependent dehydrogenase (short-subunit alcohol dehydrogenase family)
VAIITGAGSGIGRGTALAFVREGAKVVIADWSEEGGKETASLVEQAGGEAVFVKTDVSKSADVDVMVQTCLEKFGKVDILVNNAGIVKFGALHETPEEDWDATIDVNLKSIFLATKKVIPEMLKAGKGKIVNIASIAGLVGFDQIAPYCASKGGIIAFTRATALEYAKSKININCIAPGVIKTAMTKDMLASEESKKGYESQTPYPRLGEPEDIAQAVLYLASDESDFVTGQTLAVDGGWIIK